MLPLSALADANVAWGAANVSDSDVRVRSGPGTNHSVLTHANRGDVVVIIERTNSEWYKINFHGTEGYMNVSLLERSREAANFNKTGKVSGSVVNMRARPDTTSNILESYNSGTVMNIIGINNGWYKVEHGSLTGYIRSDLMTIQPRKNNSTSPLGRQIADFAVGFVGHKYVWGGQSPSTGFDCSGLVTYVMKQFGISVTRYASGQYRDNGTHVNKSDLIPGDLVFFSSNGSSITHVGIYLGNNRFVHASGTNKGVVISDLNSSYYLRVWYGAKRVA